MKKYIIYLVIFVALFGVSTAGILFYKSYLKKTAAPTISSEIPIQTPTTPTTPTTSTPPTESTAKPAAVVKKTTSNFIWGGTYQPALEWTQADISSELKMVHDNGINYIRFVYVPLNNPDTSMADFVFKAAQDNNIKVVLILEPQNLNFSNNLNYQKIGSDYASEAIKRFGNQVDYYQLANEVGGAALKSGDGQTFSQFDTIKYKHIKDMVNGMISSIKKSDFGAKTIISNQWLHYAILDKLIADKVNFDIIGWNWFPAGIDMDKVQYAPGKSINMLVKLAGYNKVVWLTEFNRDHGSNGNNGETLQAQYLQDKLTKYYKSGVFNAIFVHSMFDSKPDGNTQDKDMHWGIFATPNITSHQTKKAVEVYSKIIKQYPTITN